MQDQDERNIKIIQALDISSNKDNNLNMLTAMLVLKDTNTGEKLLKIESTEKMKEQKGMFLVVNSVFKLAAKDILKITKKKKGNGIRVVVEYTIIGQKNLDILKGNEIDNPIGIISENEWEDFIKGTKQIEFHR